jgi:hypothetical protein
MPVLPYFKEIQFPSNALISSPFFGIKTFFSPKYVFCIIPSKFVGMPKNQQLHAVCVDV